jgi:hypothetical protein
MSGTCRRKSQQIRRREMNTIEKIRQKVYKSAGTIHEPTKIFTNDFLSSSTDLAKVGKCVYRLWYGKKYIIWYGVTLWGSFYHFKRGFDNWGPDKEVFHQKMYQYMWDHRGKDLRVELMFESESDYQILKFQQAELDKALVYDHDDRCLNSEQWAYVPIWNNHNKQYGNFSAPLVRSYLRWIQSERYLKAKTGW